MNYIVGIEFYLTHGFVFYEHRILDTGQMLPAVQIQLWCYFI